MEVSVNVKLGRTTYMKAMVYNYLDFALLTLNWICFFYMPKVFQTFVYFLNSVTTAYQKKHYSVHILTLKHRHKLLN